MSDERGIGFVQRYNIEAGFPYKGLASYNIVESDEGEFVRYEDVQHLIMRDLDE